MKLAIFGASGFSREVRDIAVITGYDEVVFIDKTAGGNTVGCAVLPESEVRLLARAGFRFAIGIGSPKIRKKISSDYPDLDYANLIHPAATFGYEQLGQVRTKQGNIICAGVRMTNHIECGSFGIYNLNCMVGHDCVMEDFVTVSPGANISGNVKLSECCYIGATACIIQGRSITEKLVIGRGSTVGAGAVVTKSIPDDIIVKGIPAK